MRRSELISLDVEDIEEIKEGLRITIHKYKTDEEGQGQIIGIPYGVISKLVQYVHLKNG